MKLLIRRDQKSGLLASAITFTLNCRAEVSEEEKLNIKKYKMGKTVLYSKNGQAIGGSGMLGLASRLAHKMLNVEVTVDDLANGKHIECKDILEMRAVEEQIKEACQNFKAVLETATHFGGEEILEI